MKRKVIIYGDAFLLFYRSLDKKTSLKVEYVLDMIRFEKRLPSKFFKFLVGTDGIYEIRVVTVFKSIRILCFFDHDELIVLTNCFLKKTQKTPPGEIRLAENLKKKYFIDKSGGFLT